MHSSKGVRDPRTALDTGEDAIGRRLSEFVVERLSMFRSEMCIRALPPHTMPRVLDGFWNWDNAEFVPNEAAKDGGEEVVREVTSTLVAAAMQDRDGYAAICKYDPGEGSGRQLVVVTPQVKHAAAVLPQSEPQRLVVVLATMNGPASPLGMPDILTRQWCHALAQSISAHFLRSASFITAEKVENIFAFASSQVARQASHEEALRVKYSVRWALDDTLRQWRDRQIEPLAQEEEANRLDMKSAFLQDEVYFLRHRDEFLEKYNLQFVAIRDGEVLGYASTRREMIERRIVTPDNGAFVRKIEPEAFGPMPSAMTTLG